jgi:hypothetical protein
MKPPITIKFKYLSGGKINAVTSFKNQEPNKTD